MDSFKQFVIDRCKGSEFEFVLKNAQTNKDAREILKDRGFQRRLFAHIRKKTSSPEQTAKKLLYKAGVAIAIVLFEQLLTYLLQRRKT